MPQRTRNEMRYSDVKDTIFALSTPVGGAISVLRASGSRCFPVLKEIFSGKIEPRMLNCGGVYAPSADGRRRVDSAMAVYFPSPHSYTGEDMFELHLHGSYAIAREVAAILGGLGLRHAEPGEFTKRAFLNGRMDLIQADAVMDLILADTERSAGAALEQLSGGLSAKLAAIEEALIALGAEFAAAMDYPDEMEDEALSDSEAILKSALDELDALISNGKSGRILRDGAKAVIIGRPNAGKSSLMNVLTGAGRAIVTDIEGTTRDIIEEKLNINGYPIRLIDTAGLRDSSDPIEKLGIERARAEAATAELIIRLFDCGQDLTEFELEEIRRDNSKTLYAVNKSDTGIEKCRELTRELENLRPDIGSVIISCKTESGVDALKEAILSHLGVSEAGGRELVTNERHLACLMNARRELHDVEAAAGMELKALSLNSALMYLGEITGRTAGEEIIDGIFSRFCVGK